MQLCLRASFVAVLLAGGLGAEASAQTPEQFYAGKTVDFVIGYPPGGSNDTFGRLLARHLGKHIPGKPAIVPKNQPGAGSFLAVNSTDLLDFPRCGRVTGISSGRGFPKVALGSLWESSPQNAPVALLMALAGTLSGIELSRRQLHETPQCRSHRCLDVGIVGMAVDAAHFEMGRQALQEQESLFDRQWLCCRRDVTQLRIAKPERHAASECRQLASGRTATNAEGRTRAPQTLTVAGFAILITPVTKRPRRKGRGQNDVARTPPTNNPSGAR